MKVLQVHLTESQHKKLRVMSAERCVAMSELVRWWIDGNIAVVGAVTAGGGSAVVDGVNGPSPKVRPIKPVEKPKPDQKTCKHYMTIKPEGGSVCLKCGYEPSIV